MAYKFLIKKCTTVRYSSCNAKRVMAIARQTKLEQYKTLISSDLARLLRILDPRFPKDMLEDYDVLRANVVLPVSESGESIRTDRLHTELVSLFELLVDSNGHPYGAHEDA